MDNFRYLIQKHRNVIEDWIQSQTSSPVFVQVNIPPSPTELPSYVKREIQQGFASLVHNHLKEEKEALKAMSKLHIQLDADPYIKEKDAAVLYKVLALCASKVPSLQSINKESVKDAVGAYNAAAGKTAVVGTAGTD